MNKADLWWDDRERVFSYYETQQYYEALGPFGQYSHAVPFSSVVQTFFGRGRLSGTFDDRTRLRLRENMFAALSELDEFLSATR